MRLKLLKFQNLFFAFVLTILFFSCTSPMPKDIHNDGGLRFIVELDIKDIIRLNIVDNNDSAIILSFIKANELKLPSEEGFGELFIEKLNQYRENNSIASYFKIPGLNVNASAKDCLMALYRQIDLCKKEAIQVLATRIKNYGIEGAQIHSLGNEGRILVEIPGIKENAGLRNLLQSSSNLEFYETYENADISPLLEKVNQKLSAIFLSDSLKNAKNKKLNSKTNSSLIEQLNSQDEINKDSLDNIKLKNPLWSRLSPSIKYDEASQPIGYGDGPTVGYALLTDTSIINDFLARPEIKKILPRDSKFLWSFKPCDSEGSILGLIAIKAERNGNATLSGNFIAYAKAKTDEHTGRGVITISMNNEGTWIWKKMTKNNINKSIAIAIDHKVFSFPRVQSEIMGGETQITGDFTIGEANELENLLSSGYLGYKLKIIEEKVISPTSTN